MANLLSELSIKPPVYSKTGETIKGQGLLGLPGGNQTLEGAKFCQGPEGSKRYNRVYVGELPVPQDIIHNSIFSF